MKKRAFTLIEIMIVVLIIGVLLSIAVPNMIHARDTANAQGCISNLHQIDSAKEMAKVDYRFLDTFVPNSSVLVPEYIKIMPVCPSGGKYAINAISAYPTCTITSPIAHVIQ
ncbi:MAG TPA: prepilin-type N-terminal cleavage/methylation domain-containing protein [Fimbriimonadaceae bacterium]|jgi:prepilin-type N-terminal cleavage/methylation domain-containing protein